LPGHRQAVAIQKRANWKALGNWSPGSGSQKGHGDIKIISRGHFIFAAYDAENGKPLYTGEGTCILNGSSYIAPTNVTSNPQFPGLTLVVGRSPIHDQAHGQQSGANGIHPRIQMQQEDLLGGGKNVSLTVRIYLQADASNGSIRPGDLLTPSATPGYAMKVPTIPKPKAQSSAKP
jgi:hypothetical protein